MRILCISFFIVCITLILQGCKKNDNSATPVAQSANPFGVLVNQADSQTLSVNQRIDLLKNQFKVPYTRVSIPIPNWTGTLTSFEEFSGAGLKILLNVSSKVTSASVPAGPYIVDTAFYRQKLVEILNKYIPEVLVVENEEANSSYYTGTAQEYLTLLEIAIDEAKKRNLKVTNGGFTARMSKLLTWDYYQSTGQTAKALSYAQRVFPDAVANDVAGYLAANNQVNTVFQKAKALVNAYKNNQMSFVNFHWYEPAKEGDLPTANLPNINSADMTAFEETVTFLKTFTNKPVITNEVGQLNTKGGLTTDVLQKCYDLKLPYVVWYSGDGQNYGEAKALYDGTSTLRESGIAFKNFISTKVK
jgi:hypothetical protein